MFDRVLNIPLVSLTQYSPVLLFYTPWKLTYYLNPFKVWFAQKGHANLKKLAAERVIFLYEWFILYSFFSLECFRDYHNEEDPLTYEAFTFCLASRLKRLCILIFSFLQQIAEGSFLNWLCAGVDIGVRLMKQTFATVLSLSY